MLTTQCGLPRQVLRGAGYFEHALFVAKAAGEVGWYLDILLSDCESYDDALAFIQGLGRAEAGDTLKRHGKVRHFIKLRCKLVQAI